ncbi:MAG: hypothetical protein Q9187_008366, partial [Circinaria calcarea]
MSERNGHSREVSLITKTVDKLIDASKVVQHRMGVKPAEERRVSEAFSLLARGPPSADSKGAKQRVIYLDFLQRVQKVMGFSKVVLCAASLGPSAVANMRDRVRVELPFLMKEREDAFENGVLQGLADTYSAQCEFGSLTLLSRRVDTRQSPYVKIPATDWRHSGGRMLRRMEGRAEEQWVVAVAEDVYRAVEGVEEAMEE